MDLERSGGTFGQICTHLDIQINKEIDSELQWHIWTDLFTFHVKIYKDMHSVPHMQIDMFFSEKGSIDSILHIHIYIHIQCKAKICPKRILDM